MSRCSHPAGPVEVELPLEFGWPTCSGPRRRRSRSAATSSAASTTRTISSRRTGGHPAADSTVTYPTGATSASGSSTERNARHQRAGAVGQRQREEADPDRDQRGDGADQGAHPAPAAAVSGPPRSRPRGGAGEPASSTVPSRYGTPSAIRGAGTSASISRATVPVRPWPPAPPRRRSRCPSSARASAIGRHSATSAATSTATAATDSVSRTRTHTAGRAGARPSPAAPGRERRAARPARCGPAPGSATSPAAAAPRPISRPPIRPGRSVPSIQIGASTTWANDDRDDDARPADHRADAEERAPVAAATAAASRWIRRAAARPRSGRPARPAAPIVSRPRIAIPASVTRSRSAPGPDGSRRARGRRLTNRRPARSLRQGGSSRRPAAGVGPAVPRVGWTAASCEPAGRRGRPAGDPVDQLAGVSVPSAMPEPGQLPVLGAARRPLTSARPCSTPKKGSAVALHDQHRGRSIRPATTIGHSGGTLQRPPTWSQAPRRPSAVASPAASAPDASAPCPG